MCPNCKMHKMSVYWEDKVQFWTYEFVKWHFCSFISGFVSCSIDEMQLLSGQDRIATCAITQFMMTLKTEIEPKWKLYININSVKYVRLLELEGLRIA